MYVQQILLGNRAVCETMLKKYDRARQASDDSMAHAHCMLENYGYTHTHTLGICNRFCFFDGNDGYASQCYVIHVHCLAS